MLQPQFIDLIEDAELQPHPGSIGLQSDQVVDLPLGEMDDPAAMLQFSQGRSLQPPQEGAGSQQPPQEASGSRQERQLQQQPHPQQQQQQQQQQHQQQLQQQTPQQQPQQEQQHSKKNKDSPPWCRPSESEEDRCVRSNVARRCGFPPTNLLQCRHLAHVGFTLLP